MTEEVNGEITEYVNISELSTIDDKKLSQQERFVLDVLKDFEYVDDFGVAHKADPVSLLKQVVEESNKVITQNAKGDIIPDYKSRANLKIKLLESMGVIKQKQPEVRINFLSMLFGKKD